MERGLDHATLSQPVVAVGRGQRVADDLAHGFPRLALAEVLVLLLEHFFDVRRVAHDVAL
jgi:hypothetical protein